MQSARHKRSNINLVIPFLVIALVFGVLIWQKYRSSRTPVPAPHVQQPAGTHTAVLFFVGDDGGLARETRELEPCDGQAACVKEVLGELFNGSIGELEDALPEGATLNAVRIDGDVAVVDVSRNFVDDMPPGSSAEMAAVYSIVDTVCVNFPQIGRVKLTVEGDGKTVLQHLDLSAPLAPDYTLETGGAAGSGQTPPPPAPRKGHP